MSELVVHAQPMYSCIILRYRKVPLFAMHFAFRVPTGHVAPKIVISYHIATGRVFCFSVARKALSLAETRAVTYRIERIIERTQWSS